MSERTQMVVVDGVRYRPEDAPKKVEQKEPKQAPKPANKARSADNK